jgi:hypothetical protein
MPTSLKSIALLAATALAASAQFANYPDPSTPRTRDGMPDLAAPAPRLNGKPDLTGVWRAERAPASAYQQVFGASGVGLQVDLFDTTPRFINFFMGTKPGDEPLTEAGKAALTQNRRGDSPTLHCLPEGVPGSLFVFAFKIIQTPREIVQLSETGDPPRQIYIDGRKLPADLDPTWIGTSVGEWDGDTLVVRTSGFIPLAWLDGSGHPRSESTVVNERYHRHDFGHMDLDITIEEPKYYTRPISFSSVLNLLPDTDVFETVCAENEKDAAHLKR